ncbi:MAG: diacylglycerol kinase [Burkholderiales bacterium]|nr:diacylglycerol kinase [Burkholderiales bacterium]
MNGPVDQQKPAPPKSRGGLQRLLPALRYSLAGLRAAWQHEAAFRQEVYAGLPLMLIAPFIAAERWQIALLIGAILLVWITELLNSGLEALCDTVSREAHPLLGRAKDLGSAAVLLSIVNAVLVWALLL